MSQNQDERSMNKAAGDLLNRVHCQSGERAAAEKPSVRLRIWYTWRKLSSLNLSYEYNIRNGVDCEQEASPAAREC
jgi:hypothetical protein